MDLVGLGGGAETDYTAEKQRGKTQRRQAFPKREHKIWSLYGTGSRNRGLALVPQLSVTDVIRNTIPPCLPCSDWEAQSSCKLKSPQICWLQVSGLSNKRPARRRPRTIGQGHRHNAAAGEDGSQEAFEKLTWVGFPPQERC